MTESTTPRHPPIRVNLLHAHGSPTNYLYRQHECRCSACKAAMSEYNAEYYAAHREERRTYGAEYYAAHREETIACNAAYYAAHREEMAAYKATYNVAYRIAHREEIVAYFVAHPEVYAANNRKRRARKHNAPGSHTATDIRAQYNRQRGRCLWCGVRVSWGKKHIDHVMPLALGGSDGPENIVIACSHCNQTKKAKHPMDFAGILF